MDWLETALNKVKNMPEEAKAIRKAAEEDLFFFARLVNPGYMYGSVHAEIFRWLQEYNLYGLGEGLTSNKLIMLPRAHLKSHMMATWCAWMITRHPEITILYVSATAELAIIQLYDIKNILTSSKFQRYWPEYIHPDEGKRDKWTEKKISIDHPKRREEGIRDATIATAGITTTTTGWHADVIVGDDLVVPENAYTEEGRENVIKKASQFTSIRNAGGFTLASGTRYHPKDIYGVWKDQTYEVYTKEGEIEDKKPVWEIKEYVVETDYRYLWPRVVREDGKAFGFDNMVLARIKAEYADQVQFYAQYYNDPNDPGSNRIDRECFQYFSPRFLKKQGSSWYYNNKRLNMYAAVDFAFSLKTAADYTAIVVIGVDSDSNVYVVDIDRFKSDKIIDYFKSIKALHERWNFRKLQAEITAAQKPIVNSIKDFVRRDGMTLGIVEFRPSKVEGSKEERIAAVLEHRYNERSVWHFEGGWTHVLEDELIQARPKHDDVKDALASAVSIAVAPSKSNSNKIADFLKAKPKNRFGGFI